VSIVPLSAAQEPIIVIDGIKEAAWGEPLAVDPTPDMSEPNLDLQGLYVVEDADNLYIGFDATASNWGMTYGIYLDTDQVDGSGATSDPWGRAVNAVPAHLPEHTLYVYHEGGDVLQDAQLNHWDGSGWSYDSLISQGGAQAYDPDADWIEYLVPKAALGYPARIAIEVFTTGGDGHAQDIVPSDPNVAYTEPDWGNDVTTLSAFAFFPPPSWYVRGDFNGWGTDDPMYDDGTQGDAATSSRWRPTIGRRDIPAPAIAGWTRRRSTRQLRSPLTPAPTPTAGCPKRMSSASAPSRAPGRRGATGRAGTTQIPPRP
jgi:hypothetical protein